MLATRYKKAITAYTRKRYAKAKRKRKTIILGQLIAITGYNRTYAARILRLTEEKVIGYSRINDKRIKYVIGKIKYSLVIQFKGFMFLQIKYFRFIIKIP